MPTTSRFPWPQRTTLVAGILLLISAVLLLLVRSQAALPITNTFVIPLAGPAVSFAATVVRAAGFLVAAIGIGGELGIAADSRVGRTALVVWGVRDLVFALLALAPLDIATVGPGLGYVVMAITILFAAAALVSAVLVIRARVLSGLARWVLLPVAIVDCAFTSMSFLPGSVVLSVQTAMLAAPTEFIDPVLAGLVGIAFLLWSRTEALKHRAKVAYDAW